MSKLQNLFIGYRPLNRGEVIMQMLPDYVAKIFYRDEDTQIWTNDFGIAFGNSKPSSPEEIKKALEWLVKKFGGAVHWSNTNA